MGTRSHIYIETENGHIGLYCQYDGYPEHMYEQVDRRSYHELYGIILKATTTGGCASITTASVDYFSQRGVEGFLVRPGCPQESSYVSYIYVKRRDGTTWYRPRGEADWRQYDPFFAGGPGFEGESL